MTSGANEASAHLPALHDALDSATLAALAVERGDRGQAQNALLEASAAAASAFPAGSREAEALSMIFTAIDRAATTPEPRWDVAPAHIDGPELGGW
ncbi:MAG TPA: hypothetical protein VNF47_11240 [Streptosporangiaceae bacterium]|nr:hypothetical protein [Streptosporangiaceae bacterium]